MKVKDGKMEKKNDNKTNNKSKIIYIGLIILVIVLIIVGVLIYKEKTAYIPYNIIDVSECSNKKCNKTYKFNKNIISINYDENNNYKVKLNDKEVFTGGDFAILDKKIYTFDEMILFAVTLSDKSKNIQIYDTKGKEQVISELSDVGMYINDYKINGTEVTLSASRFLDKESFLYGYTRDTLVKITDCDSYLKHKDIMAAGTYKMTYSNGKFSKLERIDSTNLENYKDYSKLCEK